MKFLLLCTLILGLAFFMASGKDCNSLPQSLENEAPIADHGDHHRVVRSIKFADDVKPQSKQGDVACCG
ncbi:uncharacterized protein LOC108089742 isoform X1 [Drosophila ficusphila]|uniref:uncharacterized protein LOC108089742 isoform X1 n=1 Tax=Drosophila ficusphila TaxID=30025 RepID=UPI0007E89C55|nr:uncharacterized protein LOC108089742 isoform X1 [Drosophila ficusphila]